VVGFGVHAVALLGVVCQWLDVCVSRTARCVLWLLCVVRVGVALAWVWCLFDDGVRIRFFGLQDFFRGIMLSVCQIEFMLAFLAREHGSGCCAVLAVRAWWLWAFVGVCAASGLFVLGGG